MPGGVFLAARSSALESNGSLPQPDQSSDCAIVLRGKYVGGLSNSFAYINTAAQFAIKLQCALQVSPHIADHGGAFDLIDAASRAFPLGKEKRQRAAHLTLQGKHCVGSLRPAGQAPPQQGRFYAILKMPTKLGGQWCWNSTNGNSGLEVHVNPSFLDWEVHGFSYFAGYDNASTVSLWRSVFASGGSPQLASSEGDTHRAAETHRRVCTRRTTWVVHLHFRNGDVGPEMVSMNTKRSNQKDFGVSPKYVPFEFYLPILDALREEIARVCSPPAELIVHAEDKLSAGQLSELRRAFCGRDSNICSARYSVAENANEDFREMVECGDVLVLGNSGFSMLASVIRTKGLVIGQFKGHYRNMPESYGNTTYLMLSTPTEPALRRVASAHAEALRNNRARFCHQSAPTKATFNTTSTSGIL
eukprot:CAMPEP_0185743428 /NCGR_PEP_ID=MMETSP1174-20130828/1169_1 /TAXON_ID=35687 /ORGANISM="Dictyocha speculum, Strain CCMP1381" /LENGTH=416 /DNA_ID=CAMNT_0028416111 /DNA_START=243 /DNA_END=1494 /DNA_ORIENTATION=+